MAQLVALMFGGVLGGVFEVVGSNLAIDTVNIRMFKILMDPRIQVKLDNIRCAEIYFHKHHYFRATQDQKLMQIYTVDKYRGI